MQWQAENLLRLPFFKTEGEHTMNGKTYTASHPFKFARDFIGTDTVTVSSGQVDVDGLKLNESHISFLIRNDLITVDNQEDQGVSEVVFEVDNSVEKIMKDAIKRANSFTRKAALDAWAKDEYGIDLDAGDKLDSMKTKFADAIEEKMLSDALENKMINGAVENKAE
jgi:hypothetical protein